MSLYGALYSGVSGLSAQSSAMGAISDNISNVNTVGYKGAKVNFNTLVTKQVSLTNYSPGGVQSKPRASIDVQGLLQATNSSTDVGISGQGFFVVNEAANPGDGDMFAYTRAGSFKVDKEGYLQNVSGWYMQGWPLEAWDNSLQASTVTVGNSTYMKAYKDDKGSQVYINDNIVSSTHLRPLNLNNIGGTASQTRNLRMGANLPNGDLIGATHKQPVTIYDSLGGDATVQFNWKKSAQNNWGLEAIPPYGAKSMTLKNKNAAGNAGNVYSSMGRMDFLGLPKTSGALGMKINGSGYVFNTSSGTDGQGTTRTLDLSGGLTGGSKLSLYLNGSTSATSFTLSSAATSASLAATELNANASFSSSGLYAVANGTNLNIYGAQNTVDLAGGTNQFATGALWSSTAMGTNQFYSDPSSVSVGTFVGDMASDINKAFHMEYDSLYLDVAGATGTDDLALKVNGTTYTFNNLGTGLATTNASSMANSLNANTTFSGLGLKAVANGTRLHVYSENAMTFDVDNTALAGSSGVFLGASWRDLASGTAGVGTATNTKTTSGVTYCEQLAGTDSLVFRQRDTTDDITVSGLGSLDLGNGNPATVQNEDLNSPNSFTVAAAPDSTLSAVVFNGDGTPNTINVGFMDVDWANGSKDMSGSDSIGLFLGNTGIRDGMTQLNGDYQLAYWSQNGAKFGNFSGVSIGSDGIVTALFDNGVTRPVFQIPVSTFVNPNGMESMSGNVFIATDNSGEPTLRSAGSAGAGQVNAASLEASTVDIGTEFTTMIVTQRAYSAAAKIITTADQMLDELVQIKR
ncbi:MAG: flagellar hook-basal body complex protein [Bacteroidales bacterium]